jgi:hypothetical protein
MTGPHLLPERLQELAIGDTPPPTDPEAGHGSDVSDVTTPLGRNVTPGTIITSQSTGTDSHLASPVR